MSSQVGFRPPQEVPIPVGVIWAAWRSHKISDEDAVKDLIRSRDRGAVLALQQIETLIKRSRTIELEEEILRVQATLEARQCGFIDHPVIQRFLAQFQNHQYGVQPRTLCLLLVGDSRQGKSTKAMSLYNVKNTLKVSCQGLPKGVLPSLARFDRSKHKAIVWDEIRPDQVLNHRELFQSNAFEQILSQSICNQHSYGVWLYFTAMILCANEFKMVAPGIPAGDSQWLQANLLLAELGPGQKWFLSV